MDAAHYERLADRRVQCRLCPHACVIACGKRGRCRVRENREGTLVALTYARAASVALDPIEKKPLYHFHPGSNILSMGSWGCNLACAFCQNHGISQREVPTEELLPGDAVALAQARGSIGMAYTYNEPLIMWEYLRDCGRAMHDAGLQNVLVTNGFVMPEPLADLLPVIDAMNIDIKAFHEGFYREHCQGMLAPVLESAKTAAAACHLEITTLIIPGYNDAPKELEEEAQWIAEHCGPETPVHLSAYFPRYRFRADPTPLAVLLHAREILGRSLQHVYVGNVQAAEGADTVCASCGARVVVRVGYRVDTSGMAADGRCGRCGADNHMVAGPVGRDRN